MACSADSSPPSIVITPDCDHPPVGFGIDVVDATTLAPLASFVVNGVACGADEGGCFIATNAPTLHLSIQAPGYVGVEEDATNVAPGGDACTGVFATTIKVKLARVPDAG